MSDGMIPLEPVGSVKTVFGRSPENREVVRKGPGGRQGPVLPNPAPADAPSAVDAPSEHDNRGVQKCHVLWPFGHSWIGPGSSGRPTWGSRRGRIFRANVLSPAPAGLIRSANGSCDADKGGVGGERGHDVPLPTRQSRFATVAHGGLPRRKPALSGSARRSSFIRNGAFIAPNPEIPRRYRLSGRLRGRLFCPRGSGNTGPHH